MSHVAESVVPTLERKRELVARLLRERAGLSRDGASLVHRRIETQAARTPEAIALTFGSESLTYSEMNGRANVLARRLRAMGVGPEVLVGLCVGRSADMVVGLLAVLKAGGAYVPLDPAYPAERLAFMLEDARALVLLTEEKLRGELPSCAARVFCLDSEPAIIDAESNANLDDEPEASNLAYVIYTSGSTGKPKGVQVTHGAIANLLESMRNLLPITQRDALLAVTTISFDIAALEIFLPLIVGARVDLVGHDLAADAARLAERLDDPRISFLQATPATWRLLLEGGWRGKSKLTMLCGGEALPRALADRLIEKGRALWNVYGPTETTVWSSAWRVEAGEAAISIGSPIANTRLYVLDKRLRPVPVGIVGELFIGGAGLARGYRNRPGLTAERFIPDPFGSPHGGRLYQSGDLARWRPDGTLECLGRVDHQVKVRGFRIELGEIDAALARHPAVREAVVAARSDSSGEMSLAAYIVLRDGLVPTIVSELRRWLLGAIPEYMVPSRYSFLESLPLTPNGKVDRKALPEPDRARPSAGAEFVPPRGPVEEALAEIWTGVLGGDSVGAHDNFFERGGHSLLATQVVTRIRQVFGVQVPLRALFEAPTVAGLAERIEAIRVGGDSRRDASPIEPTTYAGPLPLSISQECLWFLEQLTPGLPTYTITSLLRINGPLDRAALERSINELTHRHEALRTSFIADGGAPQQIVDPDGSLSVEWIDLTGLPHEDRENEARRRAIFESRRTFDLTRAPLARVSLMRLGEADHVVLMTMHHLITDGWSYAVAASELATLYEALRHGRPSPLPALPSQYSDFARWQRHQLDSGAWSAQIEWWRRRLAGVPTLELPTDRPHPPIRSARGALHQLVLSPELSLAVRSVARREGVTPFMTLLAAFKLLLGRWSGQDDFAVGVPVANRNRAETERMIGYFVNLVALRTDLSGNPTTRELLARVRDVALEAFESQEVPLYVVIPAVSPGRDVSRTPLFQVMFVLQNNRPPSGGHLGLTFSSLDLDQGTGTAKFDLSLVFDDMPEAFSGEIEFNTDLFDAATIERFSQQYVKTLEYLINYPEGRLSELSLLTDAERAQVVAWSQAQQDSPDTFDLADRPQASAIHNVFEAQVRATPEALALVAGEDKLTYAELNARSNRLAHYLRSRGALPEVRVGLLIERPVNQIVAVLGVLKAGGAYVPLEPSLPRTRLEDMLDAARVSIMIVDSAPGRARRTSATTIDLDADRTAIALANPENPAVELDSEALSYVIFTSGSTGRPKGVMVPHRGLLTAAAAWENAYDLRQPPLRHLQAAGFAFDVFAGDWVRALSTGGTLVACPRPVLLDPAALADLIRRERIECLELVPAVADALATHLERHGEDLRGVRLLAVGSDTMRRRLYRRLCRLVGPHGRVVNSYGLTEATIDSTFFGGSIESLEAEDGPVPIGRPFPGTRAYVLDGHGEAVPLGLVGELYIGGLGVARGYLSNPRQTAERFVPDPHAGPGSRMYATGDHARWREGGVLELLGRRDGQLKVRGFRVELAEVEAAIGSWPGVRESAVVAREDGAAGQQLVACIVNEDGRALDIESLRRFLRDRLPRPMIPSQFQIIESLPRTHSGKVDRLRLSESLPDQVARVEAIMRPRNEVEEQLVAIWEDLLPVRPIGVTDDFFDIGGHSLLAVLMAARIEERFGRSLSLSDLLLGPTIEELAASIHEPVGSRRDLPLIDLGVSGPGRPLFLVHPIGGGVLCYNDLARCLDGARPVFGFQAAGFDGEAEPETDLVGMASRYIDALRTERPVGPYFVGGWSMGGIVAFEMAGQLNAAGHDVPLVILIDCSVPVPPIAPRLFSELESLAGFAADLARTAGREDWVSPERLGGLDLESLQNGKFDQTKLGREIASEIGSDRLRRLHDVFRANRLALDGYRPRPCPGRLIVIQTESSRNNLDSGSVQGWSALALGGVTIHHLAGNHYTIMQRPAVGQLAEIVAREIDQYERTMGKIPPP